MRYKFSFFSASIIIQDKNVLSKNTWKYLHLNLSINILLNKQNLENFGELFKNIFQFKFCRILNTGNCFE